MSFAATSQMDNEGSLCLNDVEGITFLYVKKNNDSSPGRASANHNPGNVSSTQVKFYWLVAATR